MCNEPPTIRKTIRNGSQASRLHGIGGTSCTTLLGAVVLGLLIHPGLVAFADDDAGKPKVAVFPLAGDAPDDLRDKVGFALRAKLDRQGTYASIPGVDMKDLLGDDKPPGFDTPADVVRKLANSAGAAVLIWGDVTNCGGPGETHAALRLKLLDLRKPEVAVQEINRKVAEPTDLRFAIEQALETLNGVGKFEHPNEEAVKEDDLSRKLWASNPNLLANGDFASDGKWNALYRSEKYSIAASATLPAMDKASIYSLTPEEQRQEGLPASYREGTHRVLAMRLSKECAENNGMACLSDPVTIQPNMRYRISFRYKSDGPSTHVFVKGYTTGRNVAGEVADREVFRTQVSPTGATGGKWATVVCDVNPDSLHFKVERLRVDLYAYLGAGVIFWDEVQLKAVGPLKDRALAR